MALKKFTLNLDIDLVSQIDDYAAGMHVNRSAAISFLLTQALQASKGLDALSIMADALKAQQQLSGNPGAGAEPQIGGKPVRET